MITLLQCGLRLVILRLGKTAILHRIKITSEGLNIFKLPAFLELHLERFWVTV